MKIFIAIITLCLMVSISFADSPKYDFGTVEKIYKQPEKLHRKSITSQKKSAFQNDKSFDVDLSDVDKSSDLEIEDANGEIIYVVPKFILQKKDKIEISKEKIKDYDRINFKFAPFDAKEFHEKTYKK